METSNIVIIVAGLAIAILLSAITQFLGNVVKKHRIALERLRKTAHVEEGQETLGDKKSAKEPGESDRAFVSLQGAQFVYAYFGARRRRLKKTTEDEGQTVF